MTTSAAKHACHLLCERGQLQSNPFGVFAVNVLNKSLPCPHPEGIQQEERYWSPYS
jgi:hypothetical protein